MACIAPLPPTPPASPSCPPREVLSSRSLVTKRYHHGVLLNGASNLRMSEISITTISRGNNGSSASAGAKNQGRGTHHSWSIFCCFRIGLSWRFPWQRSFGSSQCIFTESSPRLAANATTTSPATPAASAPSAAPRSRRKRGTPHLYGAEAKGDTAPLLKGGTEGGHCTFIESPSNFPMVWYMPRRPRRLMDNGVYHVLNRGNCRMEIFAKSGDFAAFVKLLEEGRQRTEMRILAYCLMHNHWHLAIRPRRGADISRFMGWICTTHVRRWREYRGNSGEGHLYQGRFKDFPVQTDRHLLNVLRYVEGNPLRAGIVRRAEDWPWSSLGRHAGAGGMSVQLEPWPVPRPRNWLALVNQSLNDEHLAQLRTSINRGRPFGENNWVARTAKRLSLESTIRDPWRPKSLPPPPPPR